jgi:hypothetical protein
MLRFIKLNFIYHCDTECHYDKLCSTKLCYNECYNVACHYAEY